MNVAVLGANGPTGHLLVQELLGRGHRVVAITRHPEQFALQHEHLTVHGADATDHTQVHRAIAGCDAVVSVLGTSYSRLPITLYSTSADAIVEAMRAEQIQRLVVTSSTATIGWIDPSWSWWERNLTHRILNRLGRSLYADMRRMEHIVEHSHLAWTIMRPLGLANMEPPTTYATAEDHISGRQTARRDLASAISDELDHDHHIGHHIAVATTNKTTSLPATIWREGIRPKLSHPEHPHANTHTHVNHGQGRR